MNGGVEFLGIFAFHKERCLFVECHETEIVWGRFRHSDNVLDKVFDRRFAFALVSPFLAVLLHHPKNVSKLEVGGVIVPASSSERDTVYFRAVGTGKLGGCSFSLLLLSNMVFDRFSGGNEFGNLFVIDSSVVSEWYLVGGNPKGSQSVVAFHL